MYAIEFETDITSKFIEIRDFKKLENKHARVIILVTEPLKERTKFSIAGDLKKYSNPSLISEEKNLAWQHMIEDKNVIT